MWPPRLMNRPIKKACRFAGQEPLPAGERAARPASTFRHAADTWRGTPGEADLGRPLRLQGFAWSGIGECVVVVSRWGHSPFAIARRRRRSDLRAMRTMTTVTARPPMSPIASI